MPLTLLRADGSCDLVLARSLALFDGATLVHVAGQAIDKPGGLVGWTLKPDVSGADR